MFDHYDHGHDPEVEYRRKLIMEIVENQLRNNDPPEIQQTLERLLTEGIAFDEAMRLLGCVVTAEIFDVLKEQKPYDEQRYVAALNRLPQLPWD